MSAHKEQQQLTNDCQQQQPEQQQPEQKQHQQTELPNQEQPNVNSEDPEWAFSLQNGWLDMHKGVG